MRRISLDKRHARGRKSYLRVVNVAHSGWILLCKNIVIPAVVLRNKFRKPKCEGIGEKYVWISLWIEEVFVTTYKILTFCCRWDELGFPQPEWLIIQLQDARFPLPNTATMFFTIYYLFDLITLLKSKNLTAKTHLLDCARGILHAPIPCPCHAHPMWCPRVREIPGKHIFARKTDFVQ